MMAFALSTRWSSIQLKGDNPGGFPISWAESVLNGAAIGALFQEVGSERIAKTNHENESRKGWLLRAPSPI